MKTRPDASRLDATRRASIRVTRCVVAFPPSRFCLPPPPIGLACECDVLLGMCACVVTLLNPNVFAAVRCGPHRSAQHYITLHCTALVARIESNRIESNRNSSERECESDATESAAAGSILLSYSVRCEFRIRMRSVHSESAMSSQCAPSSILDREPLLCVQYSM